MTPWGLAAGAIPTAAVILTLATRRWWAFAGSTRDERTADLPGDDLAPNARLISTRAIDIDAPVATAWAWLIQIGQDRGGFYSHTWLENLVGCRMRNADRIVPEWQHRATGDAVSIHPRAAPLRVAIVDPPRTLVLVGDRDAAVPAPDRHEDRSSWAFVLTTAARDDERCRLIIRTRTDWRPGLIRSLLWRAIDPGHFVMERTMMRGLARRAARSRRPADADRP